MGDYKDKKLIKLVSLHNELYDPSNPLFSNSTYLDEVWDEIARELDITVANCKRKWSTVCKRHKHAIKKKSYYKHESLLNFMTPYYDLYIKQNSAEVTHREEDVSDEETEDEDDNNENNKVDILMLINTIKEYPELYSPSHEKYLHHEHKNNVWTNIAGDFQTSVSLCKKKWGSVRDRYVKYLKMSPNGKHSIKYRYAHTLHFLSDAIHQVEKVKPSSVRKTGRSRKDFGLDAGFLRTYESTKKLIQLIKQYPCIYDCKNSDYSNPIVRYDAWKSIGKELQCKISSCKSRWCNIRDNYRKSIYKRKEGDRRKYLYSKHLTFLIPTFESKFNSQKGKISAPEMNDSNLDYDNFSDDDVVGSILKDAENKKFEVVQSEDIQYTDCGNDIPLQSIKQENEPQDNFVNFEIPSSNQDEGISSFLACLAQTLGTFRPYYLNRAKTEIFAIVQKYELEMILERQQGDNI